MNKQIDPIFNKMNISFEENLSKEATDIPVNHPSYKDIWRRIDNFIDKVYLVNQFKDAEYDNGDQTDIMLASRRDKLENLLLVQQKFIERYPEHTGGFLRMFSYYKNKIIKEEFTRPEDHISEIKEMIKKSIFEDENTIKEITLDVVNFCLNNFFNLNPESSVTIKDVEKEIQKVDDQIINRFSDEIVRRYPNDCIEENRIILEKPDTAQLIIQDKEKIREDFQNMLPGINKKEFHVTPTNAYNKTAAIGTLITRELEKYYGLRFNQKNGLFYISDGEGMYIPFNKDNLPKTFRKLHDKFFVREKNKDNKYISKQYYCTIKDFFELASKYCIVRVESEKNIIAFPNCAYDIKERKIYDLDYRLPRLPIKLCNINFVYDKDLNNRGGALKEVFDYCFDKETKNKIFQHYGKALFERGYTESQDSLFLMGKGNTGKTTFLESLNMIFQNHDIIDASNFSGTNDFKFGSLAENDIILLDEITTAKNKEFLEIIKLWTGGGESIQCNPKYGKIIKLDAEYIPRLVGTGNNFPSKLYKGVQGVGVLRRFDILFLKRSILEAKKFTVQIRDTTYPAYQEDQTLYIIKEPSSYTETGEAIGEAYKFVNGDFVKQFDEEGQSLIIKQTRTYFNQNELRTKETLEWFLQQVILNYKPDTDKKIHEKELREAMLKAYCPEQWVIKNHVKTHYTETEYGDYKLDHSIVISAEDLLEKIHEVVNDNLLEKAISNPNSELLEKALKKAHEINESFTKIEKGKKYFYGISFQ